MEKLIKKNQRNKLWAHARNKTTEKQLLEKLQHLEHNYEKSYRHYIRKRTRLQGELNELRLLNDDLEIVNKEKVTTSNTSLSHSDLSSQSQVVSDSCGQRFLLSNYVAVTSENSIGNCADQINSHVTSKNGVYHTHLASSSVSDIETTKFANRLGDQTRSGTRDELGVSKINCSLYGSPCRYNEGGRNDVICQHFPCHLPKTYHTLGYRRDDITPWSSDITNTDNTTTSNPKKPTKIELILTLSDLLPNGTTKYQKLRHFHSSLTGDTNHVPNYHTSRQPVYALTGDTNHVPNYHTSRQPVYALTGDTNHVPNYHTSRQPVYAPKPSDPILEQIRSGSLEPIAQIPCMTRKTVRAKIRGLKQLVLEMRERNDLTKPLDWAVNYGTRLPTRVLLNPAFPV